MDDVFVRKPTKEQQNILESCPIWEHEPESFPGKYDDREETCLVIEGKAFIDTPDGKRTTIQAGDLVTFKPNLVCTWNIITKIRKHYIFNMKQ